MNDIVCISSFLSNSPSERVTKCLKSRTERQQLLLQYSLTTSTFYLQSRSQRARIVVGIDECCPRFFWSSLAVLSTYVIPDFTRKIRGEEAEKKDGKKTRRKKHKKEVNEKEVSFRGR